MANQNVNPGLFDDPILRRLISAFLLDSWKAQVTELGSVAVKVLGLSEFGSGQRLTSLVPDVGE